jgi:hypothetical protein
MTFDWKRDLSPGIARTSWFLETDSGTVITKGMAYVSWGLGLAIETCWFVGMIGAHAQLCWSFKTTGDVMAKAGILVSSNQSQERLTHDET